MAAQFEPKEQEQPELRRRGTSPITKLNTDRQLADEFVIIDYNICSKKLKKQGQFAIGKDSRNNASIKIDIFEPSTREWVSQKAIHIRIPDDFYFLAVYNNGGIKYFIFENIFQLKFNKQTPAALNRPIIIENNKIQKSIHGKNNLTITHPDKIDIINKTIILTEFVNEEPAHSDKNFKLGEDNMTNPTTQISELLTSVTEEDMVYLFLNPDGTTTYIKKGMECSRPPEVNTSSMSALQKAIKSMDFDTQVLDKCLKCEKTTHKEYYVKGTKPQFFSKKFCQIHYCPYCKDGGLITGPKCIDCQKYDQLKLNKCSHTNEENKGCARTPQYGNYASGVRERCYLHKKDGDTFIENLYGVALNERNLYDNPLVQCSYIADDGLSCTNIAESNMLCANHTCPICKGRKRSSDPKCQSCLR